MSNFCFMLSVFFWLMIHYKEWDVAHCHGTNSSVIGAALACWILRRPCIAKVSGMGMIGGLPHDMTTFRGIIKLWLFKLLKVRFVFITEAQFQEVVDAGLFVVEQKP